MTIELLGRKVQIADSWNELTLKDQLFCYGILMTNLTNYFLPLEELQAKRMIIMRYFLSLTTEEETLLKEVFEEEHGEDADVLYNATITELLTCTDFLFEEVEVPAEEEGEAPIKYFQIKLALTKCPWAQLERRKKGKNNTKRYFGPADGLANISIYELGITFTLFEHYVNTQDKDTLHQLLAVLYRPKKRSTQQNKDSAYQGDKRQPYLNHEETVKKRKKYMAMFTPQTKQLLLFWFASCRQAIVESYPYVFNSTNQGGGGRDYGWGGILLSMADGLVDLPKVAERKATDALTYLDYLENQRREQEKRIREKK